MRIFKAVSKIILKDWLLLAIVVVSILLNVVVAVSDVETCEKATVANDLIELYGAEITSQNLLRVEAEFNETLQVAKNKYWEIYEKTTTSVERLYETGCFEDEANYLRVMVLQSMSNYGREYIENANSNISGLTGDNQAGYYSVALLSGARELLYGKLLPVVVIESLVVALYVVMKAADTASVTKTLSMEYSTRIGKKVDFVKNIVSMAIVVAFFVIIAAFSLFVFDFVCPGCLSHEIPAIADVFPYVIRFGNISEAEYCFIWLLLAFEILIVEMLAASAIGKVFRNIFTGTSLNILAWIGLGGLRICEGNCKWIEQINYWNPASLFLGFKDGTPLQLTDRWFLEETGIFVSEFTLMGVWIVLMMVVSLIVWLLFGRRELNV